MTLENNNNAEVMTPRKMAEFIHQEADKDGVMLRQALLKDGKVVAVWTIAETDTSNDAMNSQEVLQSNIEYKRYEQFDTPWTEAYEVLLHGQKIGIEQRIKEDTQAMFTSSQNSKARYDPDGSPKMDSIQSYFDSPDLKRQLCLTLPGPMYEPDGSVSGIGYDNGVRVGVSAWLEWEASWKGICYITDGKMYFTHASEMTDVAIKDLIVQQADIFTMPSVKRNGSLNPNNTLRDSRYNHYLVKRSDGTITVLYLTGTVEQKKSVLAHPNIERALYIDAVGSQGQIDQFWKSSPEWGTVKLYKWLEAEQSRQIRWPMHNLLHFYVPQEE